MKYLLISLLLIGCAATPQPVTRSYTVYVFYEGDGNVIISPEVLAEIQKEADAKSKIEQKGEISDPKFSIY